MQKIKELTKNEFGSRLTVGERLNEVIKNFNEWPDGGMVASDVGREKVKPSKAVADCTFTHCKDCQAWERYSKNSECGVCVRHPHLEQDKHEDHGCFDGLQIVADCAPKAD